MSLADPAGVNPEKPMEELCEIRAAASWAERRGKVFTRVSDSGCSSKAGDVHFHHLGELERVVKHEDERVLPQAIYEDCITIENEGNDWLVSGEAIAALLMIAAGPEGVIAGDVDGVFEDGAGEFASAAGGDVVGVGGDPEGIELVAAGERDEEFQGAGGVAMSAKGGFDGVADVAPIEDGVRVVREAEGDVSDGGAEGGAVHEEAVEGDEDAAAVGGESAGEDEVEIAVAEFTGIEKGRGERKGHGEGP